MAPCIKCKKEPAFLLQEWYCHSCFCDIFERRIKKYVRTECPFAKGDHLFVVSEVALSVLKGVIQGLPVRIECIENNLIDEKVHTFPHAKLILPWTMDQEMGSFLNNLFKGQIINEYNPLIIKLFLPVTDPEVKKYAELKKLLYIPLEKNPVFEILNQLEAKYPSSKYSLAKSVQALRAIMQNANVKKIVATQNQDGH